jgi:hypothetical protein
MKTKLFAALVAAITLFTFSSCSESLNEIDEVLASISVDEKSTGWDEAITANSDSCTFEGFLTEAEINGLMEMREEEKLAMDIYSHFYSLYEHVVFNNITKSENAHTSAILHLIEGYNLEDPAYEEPGKFSNPLFNDLFEQLTNQGEVSLTEALKVGAFVEEYDIADLKKLIDEAQNEDVVRVYTHLLNGSENHLRAFTRVLSRMGETYTPSVISDETYQEILNASNFNNGNTSNENYGVCDGSGPVNS